LLLVAATLCVYVLSPKPSSVNPSTALKGKKGKGQYERFRNMQEPKPTHGVQPIPQAHKRAGLREEHEESVQAFKEERIFLRFEELETES
jgi:hypothetical protein